MRSSSPFSPRLSPNGAPHYCHAFRWVSLALVRRQTRLPRSHRRELHAPTCMNLEGHDADGTSRGTLVRATVRKPSCELDILPYVGRLDLFETRRLLATRHCGVQR
jgi:hypothetical protein